MAETRTATNRFAVVTGANKGIGFEICRQLASNGIMVVLTARDEKRGTEALEKLKGFGLSDLVVFHQLDVANTSSISSLADFVKTHFGRLDILVNNAGISGALINWDAFKATGAPAVAGSRDQINWNELMTQTYELAKECLETNYCGAKGMIEAFIPLLQLSDSPRIVNVSSGMGKLKNIPSERVKGVLNDAETLTEEKIDELLNEFLEDFKEKSLEAKGWPTFSSAYIVSKAAMNAYTRILAKKYPTFRINCVCPGYVKTDINNNTGIYCVEEGAEHPVRLALLPDDGPTGVFFVQKEVSSFVGTCPLTNFIVDGHEYTMGYLATLLPDVDDDIYLNNRPNNVAATWREQEGICEDAISMLKMDINENNGIFSVEEGAKHPVRLALLPDDGPTGVFFVQKEVSSFVE